jgi:hypothetical protein
MTVPDDLTYERVVQRIARITAGLAAAGSAVAFALGGWSWAAGFALGGTVSWVSFRWLKQMVGALGVSHAPSNLPMKAILRYVLIGGAAYVLVKYTVINLRAAVAGLLISSAAVIIEILIELVHAKN